MSVESKELAPKIFTCTSCMGLQPELHGVMH
jgi:hypothetical protein